MYLTEKKRTKGTESGKIGKSLSQDESSDEVSGYHHGSFPPSSVPSHQSLRYDALLLYFVCACDSDQDLIYIFSYSFFVTELDMHYCFLF